MANRPVKLKLAARAALKLKSLTRVASRLVGTDGISTALANGIWTISAGSGGFVTLTGVQTLTNKTLTEPIINNPTVNGGTLSGISTTLNIQHVGAFSLTNSGWQQFIASGGVATGNYTLTINLNNTDSTVNLNGNANFSAPFALSGGFSTTYTMTGVTSVTFPTTGTLATLAGSETLTNKTLTSPVITTGSITGTSPFRLRSQGANAFDLELKNTETLTANRILTLALHDAARTIDLGGDFTIGGPVTLGALLQGDIWYASATGVMSALNKNTNATRYLSNTGTSNNPAWAQVDLSNGVTGRLPYANVTQATARSVLGVTGNATADVASIQGTANQVLVVNSAGTALAFGQVNLASASAVTGDLPFSAVAQISGYSLVGNTTASTADIAGFTVGGLTQKATPAGTDLVLIQDQAASGQLKYSTVSAVGASAGVSSIAGNTGAFTLSHGITNSTNDIRIGQLYMHANLSADQSVVTTTKTKCNFNTELYDPQGWYDNATNFRFTPLVAGKYLVTVNIFFSGTTVSNFVLTMIYKNGSELAESLNASTSSGGAATATAIVDMNGSSDFIEGWGRLSASASPVFSGGTAPITSWMSIAYIGS